LQNGICVRLFTEDDYRSRPLYTRPEILRANLAEVILRMISLKLGDITDFPFIDPPDLKSIKDGFNLLYELGAIVNRPQASGIRRQAHDDPGETKSSIGESARTVELTQKGRLMAKIPLDPRISRMLLEANDEDCIDQIAVIAAVLSIRDPRERPLAKTAAADQMHARFDDPCSDFSTLLNIWNRYHHLRHIKKSTGQLKRFCRQYFLSYNRMREWCDIHSQIRAILKEFGLPVAHRRGRVQTENLNLDKTHPLYQQIHKSILSGFLSNIAEKKEKMSGFLSNIAEKKEKNFFRATKSREVMVFPGSGLFDKAGRWIVAAEMVVAGRTGRRSVQAHISQPALGKKPG
jgi:ATP-dependent helicase HrpA